ncbi:MAG: alpha-glucosidase C-terminal domain-containing protein, partial [Spirochaetota bacterium]
IHGDYASFFADADLDSITNYECFKGLWSSFNDRNMHEIGHSLRRLFGPGGLLAGPLRDGRLPYSFADNHDVTRIASTLHEEGHLFPLHGLLWTMPGIPSVYYGSEYALHGTKEEGDESLRPPRAALEAKTHDLARWIAELNAARSGSRALRLGSYHEVVVESTTLVFERAWHDERVLVAVNADRDPVTVSLPPASSGRYRSLLGGATLTVGEDVPEIAVPALGTVIAQRVGP